MKQDGHIKDETHATSNLNTNDLRDVNDVNRLSVDEIQCEEDIPNLIKKVPAISCSIQENQMLSLETLQSQILALTKDVNGNTAALENIREPKVDSSSLLAQEPKNEVDRLKEKNYKLMTKTNI